MGGGGGGVVGAYSRMHLSLIKTSTQPDTAGHTSFLLSFKVQSMTERCLKRQIVNDVYSTVSSQKTAFDA